MDEYVLINGVIILRFASLLFFRYLARAARQAALEALDTHGVDMGLSEIATRAATVLYNHFVRRQPACALHEGNPLNAHQLDINRFRRSSLEERLGFVHAAITLVTYPCHDDRDIAQPSARCTAFTMLCPTRPECLSHMPPKPYMRAT